MKLTHLCSYENKYFVEGTITNVLEGEVAQLGRLYGIHFDIHIYKIFSQTYTHFNLSKGSLIRFHITWMVHLIGARLDVNFKDILLEVGANMCSALEYTLP